MSVLTSLHSPSAALLPWKNYYIWSVSVSARYPCCGWQGGLPAGPCCDISSRWLRWCSSLTDSIDLLPISDLQNLVVQRCQSVRCLPVWSCVDSVLCLRIMTLPVLSQVAKFFFCIRLYRHLLCVLPHAQCWCTSSLVHFDFCLEVWHMSWGHCKFLCNAW